MLLSVDNRIEDFDCRTNLNKIFKLRYPTINFVILFTLTSKSKISALFKIANSNYAETLKLLVAIG